MPIRRRFLSVALAAVPALGIISVAGAASAGTPADTTSVAVAAVQPVLPSVTIGNLTTSDTEYLVEVTQSGSYKIQFQINYPVGTVILNAAVDGRSLPAVQVASPPGPQRFAIFAYSQKVALSKGRHCFVLRASTIPSSVGIQAVIIDSSAPQS
jgi:hypothetical protein